MSSCYRYSAENQSGGAMSLKNVVYPFRPGKSVDGVARPPAQFTHKPGVKKSVRVEADVSFFCSAFLAERGCFAPAKPPKRPEA